jgi:hypothetical protein
MAAGSGRRWCSMDINMIFIIFISKPNADAGSLRRKQR